MTQKCLTLFISTVIQLYRSTLRKWEVARNRECWIRSFVLRPRTMPSIARTRNTLHKFSCPPEQSHWDAKGILSEFTDIGICDSCGSGNNRHFCADVHIRVGALSESVPVSIMVPEELAQLVFFILPMATLKTLALWFGLENLCFWDTHTEVPRNNRDGVSAHFAVLLGSRS